MFANIFRQHNSEANLHIMEVNKYIETQRKKKSATALAVYCRNSSFLAKPKMFQGYLIQSIFTLCVCAVHKRCLSAFLLITLSSAGRMGKTKNFGKKRWRKVLAMNEWMVQNTNNDTELNKIYWAMENNTLDMKAQQWINRAKFVLIAF